MAIFFLICVFAVIVLIAWIIGWIRDRYRYFKRLRLAKKGIRIFREYPNQVVSILKSRYGKNIQKSLTDFFIGKGTSINPKEIADNLSIYDIEYILFHDLRYYKEWCNAICKINKLNADYPLAIYSLCFNRFNFGFHQYRDSSDYNILSEVDIMLLSYEVSTRIASTPIEILPIIQKTNENTQNFTHALELSVYQSPTYQKAISPFVSENREKYGLNPFENMEFNPKFDYGEIAYKLRRHNITKLYHFTDRSNLNSIVKYGGLYSWSALKEYNIASKTGGDYLSHSLDSRYGLQDYVRLSANAQLPMRANLEDKGYDLVLLEIHPIVALLEETLFSNMNATANGVIVGGTHEHMGGVMVSSMVGILRRDDRRFAVSQSEVLIKHFLPLKYIMNIYDLIEPELLLKLTEQNTLNNITALDKWTIMSKRPFNQEEKDMVESAEMVSSKYGNSVKFNMKAGPAMYIPLESCHKKVGDHIDLDKCSILTLSKLGEKDIFRIRVESLS